MLKKVLACCLITIMLVTGFAAQLVYAATDSYDVATVAKIMAKTDVLSLKAKGSILIDCATGSVLVENKSHDKLPIASVTKIMTMLLIMEAIDSGKLNYEDKVPVSENSFKMGGTQVWLEPGEEFTVDEMLKAIAIRSANDCAVAMAEKIAGSEEAFVALMNQKAKELGMNDTNFLDCTGLTDTGHYSSANDVAVMSRELIVKHPGIIKYSTTWHDTFRNNTPGKKAVSLDNTNKLVHNYDGCNGLKTGFTSVAGHCLSAAAKRSNLQLVAVVLGEPDSNTRFAEARKLLDYGFANFETVKVNDKNEVAQEMAVKRGLTDKVNAIYGEDVNILVKKGEKGNIEREVKLNEGLAAPIKAGQSVGEVVYKLDGSEIWKAELVAANDVQKVSFIKIFIGLVYDWFNIGR